MSTDLSRQRFGFHLVGLARRWRRYLDSRLADAGLSDATWAPLVHLHEARGALHQKDLAARLGLDSSTLVRLLDILEAQGLVERSVDPRDRRARQVALTEAGMRAVRDIRGKLARLDGALLEGISDRDLETAMQVFDQIDRQLEIFKISGEG